LLDAYRSLELYSLCIHRLYKLCLEPAEKAFSYDEYTISLAVKKPTANEIVYSSYENAFPAGSRHNLYSFRLQTSDFRHWFTLGARGSSTLVGGIMKDTRGFKRGGGEREEPLEHFYGFYCFNCHMSIKR
jgi:hypothetical protein